jgi:hypothetical protein
VVVRGYGHEKLRRWIGKEGLLLPSFEPVYGKDDLTAFTEMHLSRAITWEISPFDSHLTEG